MQVPSTGLNLCHIQSVKFPIRLQTELCVLLPAGGCEIRETLSDGVCLAEPQTGSCAVDQEKVIYAYNRHAVVVSSELCLVMILITCFPSY